MQDRRFLAAWPCLMSPAAADAAMSRSFVTVVSSMKEPSNLFFKYFQAVSNSASVSHAVLVSAVLSRLTGGCFVTPLADDSDAEVEAIYQRASTTQLGK